MAAAPLVIRPDRGGWRVEERHSYGLFYLGTAFQRPGEQAHTSCRYACPGGPPADTVQAAAEALQRHHDDVHGAA